MGGPLLAIPLIAPVTSVEHAVVVVSFANVLANGWLLWENRASARGLRWLLMPLLVAGTVGTVFGSWLLTELDDRILSWVLAGVVVTYIVRFLTRPQFRLQDTAGRLLAGPVGLTGGILSGGTGIGGPLFATYLHALRLERTVFVFTISLIFQILGPIQMTVLASLGSYTEIRVHQALFALLPVVVVLPFGMLLARRLPQKVFEYAVLALLSLSAVRLVM